MVDLDDLDSVETAVSSLAYGQKLDRLILNAGIAPPKDVIKTASGFDATVTSSLIGHHLLTMRLLEAGLIAKDASVVIAGSEAAREHFDGDIEQAIEVQMRMDPPATYKAGDAYATVKMFVAWWAAALARRLPEGMTVNAVSPGSTPETNAINNAPFYMRKSMVPMFRLIPGMSHSVAAGAARYLEVAEYSETGKFYASKLKKMTGPLEEIRLDHILDTGALWNVTVRIAGGVSYEVA